MTFDPQAQDLTDLGTFKAFVGIPAGRVLDVNVTPHDGVYSAAPAISLTGKGSGFVGAAALDGGGHLVGVTVTKQGFGFDPAATGVVVDPTNLVSGTPATAVANVEELDSKLDAPLAREISAASAFAVDYAGLTFSSEATELYDGDELSRAWRPELGRRFFPRFSVSGEMLLRRWPITAVAEVKTLEGTTWTSVPATDGSGSDGYLFDRILLYLVGKYRFPRGIQNISVKYTAGHVKGQSYALQQIEDAVLIIAAARWNRRKDAGVSSKNLAGDKGTVVSYSRDDVPSEALAILDRFRVPRAA